MTLQAGIVATSLPYSVVLCQHSLNSYAPCKIPDIRMPGSERFDSHQLTQIPLVKVLTLSYAPFLVALCAPLARYQWPPSTETDFVGEKV